MSHSTGCLRWCLKRQVVVWKVVALPPSTALRDVRLESKHGECDRGYIAERLPSTAQGA